MLKNNYELEDKEIPSFYNMIAVDFGDNAKMYARPVRFQSDDKGEITAVLEYQTTCPGCGSLVVIDADKTKIGKDVTKIKCEECGYFKNIKIDTKIQVKAKKVEHKQKSISASMVESLNKISDNINTGEIKPTVKAKLKIDKDGHFSSDRPFIDPVALGTFTIDGL